MNCSENMKPKRKPERPKVGARPILKYLGLFVLGLMLFKAATIRAYIEQGCSTIGGEGLFLFLPLFYYPISKTVRDWLDDLRNKNQ